VYLKSSSHTLEKFLPEFKGQQVEESGIEMQNSLPSPGSSETFIPMHLVWKCDQQVAVG
jgi:hypothetical protein